METGSNDLSKILEQLEASVDYGDGAYKGTLTLDHTSIRTEASGYETRSSTVTVTKTIGPVDRNDMSYDYVGKISRDGVESVTYKVMYLGTEGGKLEPGSSDVRDSLISRAAGKAIPVLPYVLAGLPIAAQAADYGFTTTAPQDFCKSGSYEEVYGRTAGHVFDPPAAAQSSGERCPVCFPPECRTCRNTHNSGWGPGCLHRPDVPRKVRSTLYALRPCFNALLYCAADGSSRLYGKIRPLAKQISDRKPGSETCIIYSRLLLNLCQEIYKFKRPIM